MTDSAALIARLRGAANVAGGIVFEAADRLAALEAENERLQASELKMAMMQSETYLRMESAEAEAKALREAFGQIRDTCIHAVIDAIDAALVGAKGET